MVPSTFSGFNVAVSASNSGKTPWVSITNGKFSDNLWGIELNTVDYANIVKNNIELSLPKAYGLFVQQSTGYTITENNFTNTTGALQTAGILINKSGSDENVVYKNNFESLYVGVQATDKNSSQSFGQPPPPSVTGLQILCNDFSGISQADILVGYLPGLQPWVDNSVRKNQGSSQQPAGNKFIQRNSGQKVNFANHSLYDINYYYSTARYEEPIVIAGSVFKYQSNYSSYCPPLTGLPTKGGNLEHALSQYDEWNKEYENWLAKLLATEVGSEEYYLISNEVSYYSALKDNYFNSIIVAVTNEEEKGEKEKGEGSLHESLRFLFSYRAHYTDYLSITETHLAENNYNEALVTVAKMYEQIKITEEQKTELQGFETYIHWLQQLAEAGNNIYKLSDNEIKHLINYVESHTGRGAVFAKNILCELYGICIEGEGGKQKGEGSMEEEDEIIDLRKSASSACQKNILENITIHPNPTTGELQVTSYELQVTNIEILDITGKTLPSHHPVTSSSHQKIDISNLNSGIYFIKVVTKQGEVVKKGGETIKIPFRS
jgi:hypothetical protein